MKRILSAILAIVLIFSLAGTALAADLEADLKIEPKEAAQTLYELGLFKGTGTTSSGKPEFELDRAPTRHEAVTMLVRLLGKEDEALSGNWYTPFNDVDEWAKPYVGYAYQKGLTTGTSATTYSGDDRVTATQYLTFVLRALGYDSSKDFQWDKAWLLSDKLKITDGRYKEESTFTRGDVAIISYNALFAELKGTDDTLLETLPKSLPYRDDILAEIKLGFEAYNQINSTLSGYGRVTVTAAERSQELLLEACEHFVEAADLCWDYPELEKLAEALYDLADALEDPVYEYVDGDSLDEYLRCLELALAAASKPIEEVQAVCGKWDGVNMVVWGSYVMFF